MSFHFDLSSILLLNYIPNRHDLHQDEIYFLLAFRLRVAMMCAAFVRQTRHSNEPRDKQTWHKVNIYTRTRATGISIYATPHNAWVRAGV